MWHQEKKTGGNKNKLKLCIYIKIYTLNTQVTTPTFIEFYCVSYIVHGQNNMKESSHSINIILQIF